MWLNDATSFVKTCAELRGHLVQIPCLKQAFTPTAYLTEGDLIAVEILPMKESLPPETLCSYFRKVFISSVCVCARTHTHSLFWVFLGGGCSIPLVHIQFVSHEDSSIFTVYVAAQYGLPHFIHKSFIFSYSSVGLCTCTFEITGSLGLKTTIGAEKLSVKWLSC